MRGRYVKRRGHREQNAPKARVRRNHRRRTVDFLASVWRSPRFFDTSRPIAGSLGQTCAIGHRPTARIKSSRIHRKLRHGDMSTSTASPGAQTPRPSMLELNHARKSPLRRWRNDQMLHLTSLVGELYEAGGTKSPQPETVVKCINSQPSQSMFGAASRGIGGVEGLAHRF